MVTEAKGPSQPNRSVRRKERSEGRGVRSESQTETEIREEQQ
jgi:hypothetical protein